MKDLVVGTYFAEQVANSTYDLVSVSHCDRRPGTGQ
eukprot:CAMPEP_0180527262 /NCGR_PEP_ID=MMETSP1036_2-20121128/60143_1 /TAXON_ID=632150 /ORGANISM="Azadinium spinosum, Strain 3D9" /LENGTH=35 /DNA_ID= /DNA_START= /DNA_END= /DNA_ORIENTATION=